MRRLTQFKPVLPYSFPLTAKIIARHTYPVVDHLIDGDYWRALVSGEGMALLRVTPTLEVYLAAQTGAIDLDDALNALYYILSIDKDPRQFYAAAQADADLWDIVEPLQGIRWLRTPTVFEAVIGLIIEQHISWVSAQRSQQVLVAWANNCIRYQERAFYAYPTPAQLAAATMNDLKPLKLTTRRTALLIDLARQVTEGTLDLEVLRHLPTETVFKSLLAIKGIGHWTAANVIARALGVHHYVPYNDVALQAAANHYFKGERGRLSARETLAVFERFGCFAGEAAYHTMLRLILDRYEERV